MQKRCTLIFLPLLLILSLLTRYNAAHAQAYTESFDDINALPSKGWHLVNNSSPVGTTAWFQGTSIANSGPFDAYSGQPDAYIGANFNNTTGGAGTISNWLITPTRTIRNGDVFTFYTRKPATALGGTDYPDRLEVRLSTNGASTNVGANGAATGDFTTLLLAVNPTLIPGGYPYSWTQYTIAISALPAPVSGRIAFRYFVTGAGPLGTNSDYIGIDEVSYTPYVCPTLTITTPALPGATTGVAYTQTLSQTGALGTPQYVVSAGHLPMGLALHSDGTLQGIARETGTFNFTAAVMDASGCSGSKDFSITVECGPNPISFPAPPALCSDAGPLPLNMATPVDGTYSGTGVSGGMFDPSAGTQTVAYTYTDPYGCTHTSSTTITVLNNPGISNMLIPANGTYQGGDKLSFIVQYNDNVVVNVMGGIPYIPVTLNTGGVVQAQYVAGSGTSSLLFEYIVSATDQDPDGIVMGSTIQLNGGAINSTNGCIAATEFNSVPSTSGIIIHNAVPQIIMFNALPAVTYGGPDFDPGATTSSGLPVTLTSSDHTVATIVDGKVHIVGAGTVTITASQAGDENYHPATPVQQTLVVNRKTITVTAEAKSKVYGDSDPDFTYTYAPALAGSDAFTGTLSRTAGENAGSYTIVQNTLALSDNYQLNYIAANLTIAKAVLTVTAGDKTICMNDDAGTIPVSYAGFINGENNAVLSNEPVVNVPAYNTAGSYALTPSGGAAINYSFNYVSGQLTVHPLPEGTIAQNQTGAGVANGYLLTAPAGSSYVWSTGETTNPITVRSSGNYSVTVTNQYGCSKPFNLQISLQTLSIPNSFSPNGDGINDYWQIPELANYPQAYVTVINRDGQVVFESRNFTRWDGRYKGTVLPAGVYFYRIRKAPGTAPVTGWLNLLR